MLMNQPVTIELRGIVFATEQRSRLKYRLEGIPSATNVTFINKKIKDGDSRRKLFRTVALLIP
jgi:hypothetical protein